MVLTFFGRTLRLKKQNLQQQQYQGIHEGK